MISIMSCAETPSRRQRRGKIGTSSASRPFILHLVRFTDAGSASANFSRIIGQPPPLLLVPTPSLSLQYSYCTVLYCTVLYCTAHLFGRVRLLYLQVPYLLLAAASSRESRARRPDATSAPSRVGTRRRVTYYCTNKVKPHEAYVLVPYPSYCKVTVPSDRKLFKLGRDPGCGVRLSRCEYLAQTAPMARPHPLPHRAVPPQLAQLAPDEARDASPRRRLDDD